ncbi:MAG: MFS transporter, partial [Candidatus Heimdallarchaeota archaeon]|nr:MFS transporter [Candidatus Heimdallarchaeota archaeon]
ALVNGLGLSLLLPISALFLEDFYLLDPGDIALIIGVIGVFSLFGAPAGGWISDNLGKKITVWSTGILGGILMLVMGFQMPLLVLIFLFTLRRFFFSILSPSFRSLQSVLTPEAVRGKEFGVVQAANNLGSSFGPILGGYLYDIFLSSNFVVGSFLFFGGGVPFAVSGLLAILAMVFVLLFIKEKPVIDP